MSSWTRRSTRLILTICTTCKSLRRKMKIRRNRQPLCADNAIADGEELRDGPVEAADEAESDDAEAVAVNMGALEALLLTTHHPLTASRLAELLDLPSTKPVRGAVKDLNSAI